MRLLLALMLVPLVGAQMPLPTVAPLPDLPDYNEEDPTDFDSCLDPWMRAMLTEGRLPTGQDTNIIESNVCEWADAARDYIDNHLQNGPLGQPLVKVEYLGDATVAYGAPYTTGWKITNPGTLPVEVTLPESIAPPAHCSDLSIQVAHNADSNQVILYPEVWFKTGPQANIQLIDTIVLEVQGTMLTSTQPSVSCELQAPLIVTNVLETSTENLDATVRGFMMMDGPIKFAEVNGADLPDGKDNVTIVSMLPSGEVPLFGPNPNITINAMVTATFVEVENEWHDTDYMRVVFSSGGGTNIERHVSADDAIAVFTEPITIQAGNATEVCVLGQVRDDEFVWTDHHEVLAQARHCVIFTYTQTSALPCDVRFVHQGRPTIGPTFSCLTDVLPFP